jgi:hypothetical protein
MEGERKRKRGYGVRGEGVAKVFAFLLAAAGFSRLLKSSQNP